MTHQKLAEKLEDKETRRALDGRLGKRKRHDQSYDVIDEADGSSDDEDLDLEQKEVPQITSRDQPVAASAVGSALKRDSSGNPLPPKVRAKKVCVVCLQNACC